MPVLAKAGDLDLRLPEWHEGQQRVDAERKRLSFLIAHRGWWKTSFCIAIAMDWLLTGRDMGWWSPTHKHIQNAWIDFHRAVGHGLWFNKSDNTFTIPGRGTCYFFSMEIPDNARGFTLPGIGDEMPLWSDGVFESIVEPVVNKYGKDTWFLGNGTPNTAAPFNDCYKLIQMAERYPDEMARWVIPAFGADIVDDALVQNASPFAGYHNPSAPFPSFAAMQRAYERSERKKAWRIEYLCHFLTDDGGQFVGVNLTCSINDFKMVDGRYFGDGTEDASKRTGWYQKGVDVGIEHDFTVITVLDRNTNRMVYLHRFLPQGTNRWEKVYHAIEDVNRMFPGQLNVDCTGAGSHLAEEMPRRGVHLNEWGGGADKMKFTVSNKEPMLDHLSSLVAQQKVSFFRLDFLMDELEKMGRRARTSGGFAIEAPSGGYDDCAISCALSCKDVHPLIVSAPAHAIKPPTPSWWMTESW